MFTEISVSENWIINCVIPENSVFLIKFDQKNYDYLKKSHKSYVFISENRKLSKRWLLLSLHKKLFMFHLIAFAIPSWFGERSHRQGVSRRPWPMIYLWHQFIVSKDSQRILWSWNLQFIGLPVAISASTLTLNS